MKELPNDYVVDEELCQRSCKAPEETEGAVFVAGLELPAREHAE